MSPKTLHVTIPGDCEIAMTRVFDAPRRLVFEAITRPELLRRWFHGPPGWTLAVCEIDLRVGGAYRYVWKGPDGLEMGMGGVFREIVPPLRISATERFDQSWYPGEGIVTTSLEEREGRTTLTLTARYESKEARDIVLQSPMEEGVAAGYGRLADLLAELDGKMDLVVTRVFDAQVERVWRAWTDGPAVMQWWGPDCFTSPSAAMDVREGGTSLVCMRAPASFGGQDMYNTWLYTRIVPMEKLEFIQNLSDANGAPLDPAVLGLPKEFPRDQRNVVSFRDLGDGRTEMTVTEFGWTVSQMLVLAETGLNQCMDKLGASLAR